MDHEKKMWMTIRIIALDNGFYKSYFRKDNNGNTIEEAFEGLQVQVNSPHQDIFTDLSCEELSFDLLECHNVGDVSFPKPDRS
jgi:hypothetical protein